MHFHPHAALGRGRSSAAAAWGWVAAPPPLPSPGVGPELPTRLLGPSQELRVHRCGQRNLSYCASATEAPCRRLLFEEEDSVKKMLKHFHEIKCFKNVGVSFKKNGSTFYEKCEVGWMKK
jgi:hypothetical protein